MSRRFVWLDRWKINQFPRFEWVDHQAQEPQLDQVQEQMKRTQMIVETKRVRFTESRGQKRQGEDVEELAAKAEEQQLDADVEVPAHKTWRVEDVAGDAADAAPEQVNSFAQSKTEVFEKIEETCATRLGLREGFAVDLTTARANGTMWDLSLEDDRAELRRVQNREQPEPLAGSPPGDDFSSLLNTCVESQDISKLKTERLEPQIRACMNIPRIPRAGKCLRLNPLSATRECTALRVDVSLEFEGSRIE